MKKILLFFVLSLLFFSIDNYVFAVCDFDTDNYSSWTFKQALDGCLNTTTLVGANEWSNAIDGSGGFWDKIQVWIDNISIYLWIFAVWSIVYWALMFTLSAWEDEKITKAKNIIKWWIFWFVLLISVSAIVNLIVKIMYSLS